ncbi:unnamed protein product, partial [Rotaria socialis]
SVYKGKQFAGKSELFSEKCTALNFGPGAELVASGVDINLSGERSIAIKILDFTSRQIKTLDEFRATTPAPEKMLVGHLPGQLLAYDAASCRQLGTASAKILYSSRSEELITAACLTANGTEAIIGLERRGRVAEIRVYDLASGSLRQILTGHAARPVAIVFAGDTALTIRSEVPGRLSQLTWDLQSGKVTGTNIFDHAVSSSLLLTRSGMQQQSFLNFNDPQTGKQIGKVPYEGAYAVSGDGKLSLISIQKPRPELRLYRNADMKLLKSFSLIEAVNNISFAVDAKLFLTAGPDHNIRIWDIAAGQVKLTLRGHTDPVHMARYSTDGRLIASAGSDHVIRIWNSADGKELITLKGHTQKINDLGSSNST